MDPNPYSGGGGGVSVLSTQLNNFFWSFFKTLTICSILFMVLSIYYALFGDNNNNNNYGVVCTTTMITITYAISTQTFILPNLHKIAAVCLPFLELNKALSFRLVKIIVCTYFSSKYPFLIVYFGCSCLMTGIGMVKLYGDGSYSSYRVIDVIVLDASQPCLYQFLKYQEYGNGWVFAGLILIGSIAHYLPPLVEPQKKITAAAATGVVPSERRS